MSDWVQLESKTLTARMWKNIPGRFDPAQYYVIEREGWDIHPYPPLFGALTESLMFQGLLNVFLGDGGMARAERHFLTAPGQGIQAIDMGEAVFDELGQLRQLRG